MNNSFRRIHYASIPTIPRFSIPHSTLEENLGAHDPYRRSPPEDTPLGLMSLSLQPPSRVDIQVLNNRPQAQEEASSRPEETNAVKKLRKEIYNPAPKRISSRLCLYYRDQATNIANQMAREKEEGGKRCAVCLEDFEPKEMVMITPCNHMFHEDCIVPWVKTHAQCPVCRSSIGDPIGATSSSSFRNVVPGGDLLTGVDLISILRAMGAI